MKLSFKLGLTAISTALLCNSISHAAVVMTGTRVIFPANQTEKTIQLQNKDNNPNIVQVWVDRGNKASTPDTADGPFIANPQIFKISPNAGQMVRLTFIGDKSELPTDRESVFYLNFSEIPGVKDTGDAPNQLMIVFKNRLKVFYRPDRLPYPPEEMSKHIVYKFSGTSTQPKVTISNNSAYYANISEAYVVQQDDKTKIQKNTMIAPKTSVEWDVPLKDFDMSKAKISLGLINDYGVTVTKELHE
ncbi:molecular chaperone [Acinetobacter equi]|nr:molecular chaperone [Acinetobacter equi]